MHKDLKNVVCNVLQFVFSFGIAAIVSTVIWIVLIVSGLY